MIIEGIVTSCDQTERVNIAAMGADMAEDDARAGNAPHTFVLRPYRTSQTFRNLEQRAGGVFHVVDDAELLAQVVIGHAAPAQHLVRRAGQTVPVLDNVCRWYAFTVVAREASAARATLTCAVTSHARIRDFAGLNRATFAVLELAIIATRIEFIDEQGWRERVRHLRPLVEKTGGCREQRAFQLLTDYVEHRLS